MLLSLPWILVSFIFYNVVAFSETLSGAGNEVGEIFESELFTLNLLSGQPWQFTLGDLVLVTALIALFVEILKATQTRSLAILDHGLSVVVFIICLLEFLMVKEAGTSLFFFITLLALIDVVAGFSVGIRAARRDFNIPGA